MSKNNIFIVIDSLYYDKTVASSNHPETMPFLDKLRNEGITCTNMFSEAPYTEAALVSLLCGMDTLKKGGYLRKLYGKESIMETFKNNGYDTFCNCVQPLVYPSYSYPGLTHEYYNICYDFKSLWSYRLSFYSNEYKNNNLDDKTMNVIVDLLLDNFKEWLLFLEALKDNKEITSFIYKYIDLNDIDDTLSKVKEEYDKFNKNKLEYTKELLNFGSEHNLFKIKTYELSKRLTNQEKKEIYKRYKKIIKKMIRKNMYYNIKNNKLILSPKSEAKGLFKAYMNAIYNRFMIKKLRDDVETRKAAPSMDTTINHFEDWLLNRKSDKPYFAYIHVDDCHSPEIFYTYDTSDFLKLDEEFNAINKYLSNIPKNYAGNMSYDVSLQYADICLKRLYDFLDKNKMLDNVNIMICADHGSSYSFAPYRSNYVNNVHRENYNMPFVIWNKDLKHKTVDGLHNTKDIPATIIDLNGLKIPKEYDGMSILKSNGRDYVLLENVCGGCPDYNLRDFMLGVRNNKYLVVMNLNIHNNFQDGDIISVYDLENDKKELYNLKDSIDKKKIIKELSIIEKEFELLKKDMIKNNFLKV